ncbi:hypothetical protein HOE67_02435 [Candidatus Peregrinibacteria bacterium]|jgi:hypothetical protein|nr:hypothetical protein [Candidatus Peregrinibacteria bacterium]MBT4055946.1 hypothetical protein [Candidatus Peregrinibacteria bacterium]
MSESVDAQSDKRTLQLQSLYDFIDEGRDEVDLYELLAYYLKLYHDLCLTLISRRGDPELVEARASMTPRNGYIDEITQYVKIMTGKEYEYGHLFDHITDSVLSRTLSGRQFSQLITEFAGRLDSFPLEGYQDIVLDMIRIEMILKVLDVSEVSGDLIPFPNG